MAEQKALYIDGKWVTTADTVVNTNPSDTHDVIGEYAQVTWGLQLGGQAYSQIILFEDERAYEEFTSGNFEFGAQATAVALTAAAGAEANTTGAGTNVSGGQNDAAIASAGYRKGMAVFTIAKGGLMYEATIGGQKFDFKPAK